MKNNAARYFLSIDQGTSSTIATLYTLRGEEVAHCRTEVISTFPRAGWVEQDPAQLLDSIRKAVTTLIVQQQLEPGQIVGAGLANQGEAFVLWDIDSGEPVYPSINWQCVRSAKLVDDMIDAGEQPDFRARTGLPMDPEWPATKIPWMLENVPRARALLNKGRLAYGQLDTWFIYKLTRERRYLTDHSTASRSGLYNIAEQNWDEELKTLFQADGLRLPELCDSSGSLGVLDFGHGWRIPLYGSCLDQSAALLGQACTMPGEAKVTYGTCAALWCATGQSPVVTRRLATSVAWQIAGQPMYAIAGEAGTAGALISWAREKMQMPWSNEELSDIARSATGQEQLIFVPAFSGLSAPHWVPQAKGAIYGLLGGVGLEHLLRASLESVAYSVRDLIEALEEGSELTVSPEIKADGGMVGNHFLMQFQADILNRSIQLPSSREGTSLGVTILAAVGAGVFPAVDAVRDIWRANRVFEPQMDEAERNRHYRRWQEAVQWTIQTAHDQHSTPPG